MVDFVELDRIFLKYYRGRKVEDEDREKLEYLYEANFIEYYRKNGDKYARPCGYGRCLVPRFVPRMKLLLRRV